MKDIKLTAAEFDRCFGPYQKLVEAGPLWIASESGETLVMVSAKEFRRLRMRDREAIYAWELTAEEVDAIAQAEPPPEAAEFDHELKE